MNARKIALKVFASLALVGMLSSLSGCIEYGGRPAPRYYHRWYR